MNETPMTEHAMCSVYNQGFNMTDNKYGYWSLTTTIVFSTILIIIIILTVVGNFMVITIIIRHKNMRSKTNFFFLNLAVADILVGLFLAPITLATLINGDWIFGFGTLGAIMCNIDGFAMVMFLIVSIHTLMYISIYKYFGIINPLSTKFTNKKVGLMIAASWIWAIVCSILSVTGLTCMVFKPKTTQCGVEYPDFTKIGPLVHHILIQITDILIPITVIVYTQSKLLWAVKQYAVRLKQNACMPEYVVLAQRNRVAVTVTIVVVAFVSCWLPYHIYAMYVSLTKDKSSISSVANPMVYILIYLNSACNPIIYGFRNKAFREGYKEFVPFRRSRRDLKKHMVSERKMSDLAAKYSGDKLREIVSCEEEEHDVFLK